MTLPILPIPLPIPDNSWADVFLLASGLDIDDLELTELARVGLDSDPPLPLAPSFLPQSIAGAIIPISVFSRKFRMDRGPEGVAGEAGPGVMVDIECSETEMETDDTDSALSLRFTATLLSMPNAEC